MIKFMVSKVLCSSENLWIPHLKQIFFKFDYILFTSTHGTFAFYLTWFICYAKICLFIFSSGEPQHAQHSNGELDEAGQQGEADGQPDA